MTLFPIRDWVRHVVLTAVFFASPVLARSEVTGPSSATTPTAHVEPGQSSEASPPPRPPPATSAATPAGSPAATTASARRAADDIAAQAQASEESDWLTVMNHLARLLAGSDLVAMNRALDSAPVIRRFSSDALQTPDRMLGATTGAKVIGVHAYDKPPATLATDLADDFSAAGDVVPETIRAGMIPPDAAAARRANDTAGQWLVQVLQPQEDEVTGVIVLWPQSRSRAATAAAIAPTRATFVLVKAQQVDEGYILRQITFGDPLETPQ